MSRRTRRAVEIFNLSFLDVVSCGFGAIILLLVIVKISEPHVIEQLAVDLSGLVERLEAEVHRIRGDATVLNRDLTERQEQLSVQREKLARLKGDLSSVRGEYRTTRNEHEAQTIIESRLATAQQSLTDEMKRLSGASYRRPASSAIGGRSARVLSSIRIERTRCSIEISCSCTRESSTSARRTACCGPVPVA